MAGTTRDVTERKQLESSLLDADRRKDEFLATLAHELRNPLAPIRNAVQLLKAGKPDRGHRAHGARDHRPAGAITWCGWSTTSWTSRASPWAR